MNRSKEIEAEWISLAPDLASSGYIPVPFRVPEGYFQGFYDRLIMAIRTEASGGLLTGQSAETFEEESAAAEIESISPFLAGLSRKTPYQVPENYFAQFRVSEEKAAAIVADFGSSLPLETGIVDSETGAGRAAAGQAPVIKMKHHRSWMRMALAAMITAVVLTGAFFYFRPAAIATVSNELAKVSDEDMENFVATQDMPPNAADSSIILADANTASFNDSDITDLMSNVSDTELSDYASNDGANSNLN